MSRRICIPLLAASFALAAPAASLAQSSSQAQYQGVAPETQTPVTGGGAGTSNGGSAGGNAAGGAATSTGGGAGNSSGASGNGGAITGVPVPGGKSNVAIPAPSASSDTMPFTSTDIVLLALAALTLVGIGVVLRRSTPQPPAGG